MAVPLDTPTPAQQAEMAASNELDEVQLLQLLSTYWREAKEGRESGPQSRDETWNANWDAYWNNYDMSAKAEWQSREKLPEVPNFVDRLVASVKQAVQFDSWFQVSDLQDRDGDLTANLTNFVKVLLAHCGRNIAGQPIGFPHPFAQCTKAGAMSMLVASVTWKDGNLLIEPVDARECYWDPTGRGLYRIRRTEIDYHELDSMKDEKAPDGSPLWDREKIEQLQHHVDEELKADKRRSGSSDQGKVVSPRKPITLDEYLCTIIGSDGRVVAKNQLVVRANETHIIRGPEDNPFWHEMDWLVAAPMVSVPFSVYGRTYVENFRPLAATFVEFTNLLLDGAFASAVPAMMVWLEALKNANDVEDGVHPGATYVADEEWEPGAEFVKKVDMGEPTAAAFQTWSALKGELREGAMQSEIEAGQLPEKTHIAATGIARAGASSQAMSASMAADVEEQFLDVILLLAFFTGLQFFDADENGELAAQMGEEVAQMISGKRQEFRKRKLRFKAGGLTTLVERGRKLQQLIQALQTISANPLLARAYLAKYSLTKLVDQILLATGVDPATLEATEEEKLQELARRLEEAQAGGAGGGGSPPRTPSADPAGAV